jgi:DNA-binding LytR/AlgR family response regulator
MDGFDVIEMHGQEAPPAVVFVTAHDEYALRAFEVGALDYLLKPFDGAQFQRALPIIVNMVGCWNCISRSMGNTTWF